MFQDGVEATADDYLFTTWAGLRPDAAAVGLGSAITYLGSKVSFTWLNGTTSTCRQHRPTTPETDGSWTATSKYQFQFTLPAVYAFTKLTFAQFSPLPKHIMEAFPVSTWDSAPFSTASGPYTYHWDASKYGGSGTYTAVGPVGAGPYKLQSYDFTNNIATLVKFPGYYNATGLESIGQFTINTFKVQWISSKDAAIAALKNGQVDLLDYNYGLAKDKATLQADPQREHHSLHRIRLARDGIQHEQPSLRHRNRNPRWHRATQLTQLTQHATYAKRSATLSHVTSS